MNVALSEKDRKFREFALEGSAIHLQFIRA